MRDFRYLASYAALALTLAEYDGQTSLTALGGVHCVGNQTRFLRVGIRVGNCRTSSVKISSRGDGVILPRHVRT